MPNPENLIPNNKRPESERIANGRKGGLKSAKIRRERKKMKELLEVAMSIPMGKGKRVDIEKIKNLEELQDLNLTADQMMIFAQIQKAIGGDTQAFIAIRDTLGERPTEKIETTQQGVVIIKDDI